jgi:hypothetical protein
MVVFLPMVLFSLTGRNFSQAANATSHLKKPLIYQIGNVVRINADGERPLLRALEALQQKYGWIVDYEEPQYSADGAGAGSAASLRSRRHADARDGARHAFSVEYNVGPTPDSPPDEKSVLTTVVDAYNDDNSAAPFELRNENDSERAGGKQQERRFDLVGMNVRDDRDETQRQPILDRPIILAKRSRSAERTMALICQRVSERSGIAVSVGAIDASVAGSHQVEIGGVEAPARTLLLHTINAVGNHLNWRLLYDSNSKSYELSVDGLLQ